MDLNLYALKTFREVVDKGSFSKAAKTLFVTQPAVSLQIKSLENFFQVPLLIRGTSGKIKLTPEGQLLYKYTQKLVEFQEDLFQGMRKYAKEFSIKLRLGACFIAGEHLLPPILDSFSDNYPGTRLSLNILRCEKIYEGLLSGIFDLGITGIPTSQKTIIQKEITRVPLELYESAKNQSRSRNVSLHDLLDKPLIMREEGAGMYHEFDKLLRAHNIKISSFRHICVSQSNEAIKSLVKADMGFSVFPPFMVKEEVKKKELVRINLKEGKLDQGFYVVFKKRHVTPDHQKQIVDFMTRQIRKIELCPN